MANVLLVDDEKQMLDLLALYLNPYGYVCQKANNAAEALEHLESKQFNLVLLDIMMPGMDGFGLCKEIRKYWDVPIIMVTARDEQEDLVKGLKLGADDYVAKPIQEAELLARMEALLRRTITTEKLVSTGLVWDEDKHLISFQDKDIHLTPKEFAMLGLMMKHPGQVFHREQLLESVWGYHSETYGRTVDSHIRNIRDKIRQSGHPIDDHLVTVWGVGYKWMH